MYLFVRPQSSTGVTDHAVADVAENVTTQQQIVTFAEESVLKQTTPIPFETIVDMSPYYEDTLKSALERVVPIKRFEWLQTHTFGQEVFTALDLPQQLISNSSFISDKARNYAFMRADVRISIRMNGFKFQYGKLIIVWAPVGSLMGVGTNYRNSLTSVSGFPFVIVSPTENEVQEFVVPYSYPYEWFPLTDLRDFSWARVHCFCLNPLQDVNGDATSSANLTVYAKFENVKIGGPTIDPGITTFSLQGRALQFAARNEVVEESISLSKEKRSGYFSTIVGLGGYTRKIANAFGYNKTPNVNPQNHAKLALLDLTTSTGSTGSTLLALDPCSEVAPCEQLIGGYEGEMNFSEIFATPTLLCTTLITQDSTSWGRVLPVSPSEIAHKIFTGTYANFPTILSWGSAPFAYWRGSLRYHIDISCTQFHVGRLRITWLPNIPNGREPVGGYKRSELGDETISYVVDIQRETEFNFCVPYYSHLPWLLTAPMGRIADNLSYSVNTDTRNYASPAYNGLIVFSIENPFNSPAITQPIYMNVWVSAAEDFCVSVPRSPFLLEDFGTAVGTTDFLAVGAGGVGPLLPIELPLDVVIIAEGMNREMMRNAKYEPLLAGATGFKDTGICMGEIPTNIKDVICLPSLEFQFGYDGTTNTNGGALLPLWSAMPYFYRTLASNAPNSNVGVTNCMSTLQWYRQLFRFARGSTTYKIIPLFSSVTQADSVISHNIQVVTTRKLTVQAWNNIVIAGSPYYGDLNSNKTYDAMSYNPSVEFTLPYTNPYTAMVNTTTLNAAAGNIANQLTNTAEVRFPELGRALGLSNPMQFLINSSAGPDATLHFITGPPTLIFNLN